MISIHALHENKHLTDECVHLLNDEWPRSKAARLHSVNKSCSTLPYSLVLVENQSNVVGYCRLAKVISESESVLVESVVVDKTLRGKGYGRQLMDLAEQHTAKTGYKKMYLCTYDKQGFYEHLGYSYCKPVNTLGAQMLGTCDCAPDTNTPLPWDESADSPADSRKDYPTNSNQSCCSKRTGPSNKAMCQESQCGRTEDEKNKEDRITESVKLCEVAPPPPAPPPPPLSLAATQPTVHIYWMVKDISCL